MRLTILFSILSCSLFVNGVLAADGKGWFTYTNTRYGYSVDYPTYAVITATSPDSEMWPAIKFTDEDTPAGAITIEIHKKNNRESLLLWIDDFSNVPPAKDDRVSRRGPIKYKHFKGYHVTYNELSGYPEDPIWEHEVIYIDRGEHVFVLLFYWHSIKKYGEQARNVNEIYKRIINSFRLLNKKGKK